MGSHTLKQVDQRTNLAGSNRLELLLFKLDDSDDIFGINVFKVREVMPTPKITRVPHADERVIGVITPREGEAAMTLIDLPFALGRMDRPCPKPEKRFTIITEYNLSTQGFLIHQVDRIIHKSWEEIESPPEGLSGDKSTLTAITRHEGCVIQIIDVENLLADIAGVENVVDFEVSLERERLEDLPPVVCAEDSAVAQNILRQILDKIGVPYRIFPNGAAAWDFIQSQQERCPLMLISDLEMPEMDGYTLIRNVREHGGQCADIPIVVNTSMSGEFNRTLIEKVGADLFVSKWEGKTLSEYVLEVVKKHLVV